MPPKEEQKIRYDEAYEKASRDLHNFLRSADMPRIYIQINEALPHLAQIYAGNECRKSGLKMCVNTIILYLLERIIKEWIRFCKRLSHFLSCKINPLINRAIL